MMRFYKTVSELLNGHVLSCTCITDGDDLFQDFVPECVFQSLDEDAVRSTGREAE